MNVGIVNEQELATSVVIVAVIVAIVVVVSIVVKMVSGIKRRVIERRRVHQ
jgi:hypothetical protein